MRPFSFCMFFSFLKAAFTEMIAFDFQKSFASTNIHGSSGNYRQLLSIKRNVGEVRLNRCYATHIPLRKRRTAGEFCFVGPNYSRMIKSTATDIQTSHLTAYEKQTGYLFGHNTWTHRCIFCKLISLPVPLSSFYISPDVSKTYLTLNAQG